MQMSGIVRANIIISFMRTSYVWYCHLHANILQLSHDIANILRIISFIRVFDIVYINITNFMRTFYDFRMILLASREHSTTFAWYWYANVWHCIFKYYHQLCTTILQLLHDIISFMRTFYDFCILLVSYEYSTTFAWYY
jgi:hypothetical protein